MEELDRQNKNQYFIIKPENGAQGNGIKLVRSIKEIDISDGHKWVCQEQVANPYLVDGYKFDTRIYVLVTSIDPLRIWLHKDGFLRLCTTKYEKPNLGNQNESTMHLTN